jgi:mannose-1-phosphate guanylyltransferase
MSHQSTARPSRRRVLATVGIASLTVVGAAGIGSVVAALAELPARHRRGDGLASIAPSARTTAPAALVTALAREQQLIARTVLARTAQPADPVLAALITDHQAHAAAIAAAIGAASAGRAPTSSATPTTPPTAAELKASEQAAHDAAAAESATVRGAAAVLLASIAACEAGHVELLAQ